jgi:6-carboxyhexanoate--CoA ligase
MKQSALYSIRMRASACGRHLSGAERITEHAHINGIVQELLARAQGKTTPPEEITIHIDRLGDEPQRYLTALDVITLSAPNMVEGRSTAARILELSGVSARAAEQGISLLSRGAAPSGGNMRGAIMMDFRTGQRLELDQERGVRVSRFDWTEGSFEKIKNELTAVGLTHFRTYEALALATKVAHAPNMMAELCWSDDPDYTAGYVASRKTGYVRFPLLKQSGDPHGGRVFFVDTETLDMAALTHYLQREVVLINDTGICRPAMEPEEYINHIQRHRQNIITETLRHGDKSS